MKPFTLDDLPRVVRRKRRAPQNAWAEIAVALNPAYARPRLADDVEIADFRYRSGEPYTMMKAPRGPSYIRLTPEDRFIVDLMDGRRTIKDIVVAHFRQYGHFALSAITSLIEEMRKAGFLSRPYVSVEKAIAVAKRDTGPSWRVRVRRIRAKKRLDMRKPDELTDWLYRHGGRALFGKAANVLYAVVTVVGLVMAWRLLQGNRYSLFGTSAASIFALYGISLLAIFVHEAAHALSCKHFGRKVNAAGFMFYMGMPLFFIETTDTWMANRRQRVLTSWSGPYSGFIIGGACAIAATLMPTNALSAFLYRFAIFSYYGTLQNLVPFLRLDGYYIMMDLIDTQNLRERSFAFLREELFDRIRTRTRLSRHEKVLTAYGVIASVFAVLAILVALAFWSRVFRQPVVNGWNAGPGTRLLILGLGVLVLAAPLRALARLVREAVRRARFVGRLLLRVAQAHWRADAVAVARSLPFLAGLDADALHEIGRRVALRRVPTGRAVITEGEHGSEFFIVRSGRLQVVRTDPDGKEIEVESLGRGSSFGEIALLQSGPRLATVRAVEPSEVFVLDKGTFDRLLADRFDLSGMHGALLSMQELKAMKPFAGLDARDAAEVIRHAEWVSVPPKEAVVRQGREADGFYVIGSGRLEVVKDRKRIGLLGPGDYFGEVALLQDSPRTATVRAVTPSRILKLDRAGFDAALGSAFSRGSLDSSAQLVREWEH
ncbi:MAG TPA: cyclic nucleotide-binding domain-containing protein [Actinomycetota bacterium]|nr:cyclic nucleotide-binding domain-containing protein [Actinomycetota bacterium]